MESQTIYVSFDKTKHIVLPAQVSDITFGREDYVKVERVDNVPNIVRITAQEEEFSGTTNLVIVCTNGNVYSYTISYLLSGMNDHCGNIVYAGDVDRSRCYDVKVNNGNTTEMFFPADVLYLNREMKKSLVLNIITIWLKLVLHLMILSLQISLLLTRI